MLAAIVVIRLVVIRLYGTRQSDKFVTSFMNREMTRCAFVTLFVQPPNKGGTVATESGLGEKGGEELVSIRFVFPLPSEGFSRFSRHLFLKNSFGMSQIPSIGGTLQIIDRTGSLLQRFVTFFDST